MTTRLTNSDARVAIKTLQYVVTGQGKDVRSAFERARHDLVVDMVSDLSDSTLLILWFLKKAILSLFRLASHKSVNVF